jgi:hypothetical protein
MSNLRVPIFRSPLPSITCSGKPAASATISFECSTQYSVLRLSPRRWNRGQVTLPELPKGVAALFRVVLMMAILVGSYKIRLLAVQNYGPVIHEFDPWFNYRAVSSAHASHDPSSWPGALTRVRNRGTHCAVCRLNTCPNTGMKSFRRGLTRKSGIRLDVP